MLFGAGDGWLYSFDPAGDGHGHSKVLWKFDCNPKTSKYSIDGRATRNHIIATPVIYDGLVYCAVGEDPEHGPGNGHLWCIDPNKSGDVSSELAVDKDGKPLPVRRIQAVITEAAKRRPQSEFGRGLALRQDPGAGGKTAFENEMHRTIGTAAIKDGLLYIADFSGLFHCLDAKTGHRYWVHDMFSESWGSPLVVEGKVYIGDGDGDVTVFQASKEKKILSEFNVGNAVYTSPVVANNVLYIANRSTLFSAAKEANRHCADRAGGFSRMTCRWTLAAHVSRFSGRGPRLDLLRPFDYDPKTRVIFGQGAVERLGEVARELGGERVLIVTDKGVKQAGHLDGCVGSLAAAGFDVALFDDVTPNPTTDDVDRALEVARREEVDLLVGLGGGSSLDCAKGVNFLFTNGGRMEDYRGLGKAKHPFLPLIAVPTTAGTGSEAQSYALIADADTHMKMACGDKKAACRAPFSIPISR